MVVPFGPPPVCSLVPALYFPAYFLFPLLCNGSVDEQQPGALLIFITHDDVLVVGCERRTQTAGVIVQSDRVSRDVDQR